MAIFTLLNNKGDLDMAFNVNKDIDITSILKALNVTSKDSVFVAGSLIEQQVNPYSRGIGNRLSDIDIFVVKDDMQECNGTYNLDYLMVDFMKINNSSYDIEFHDINYLKHIIDEFNKIDFGKSERVFNLIRLDGDAKLEDYISFFHRLNNSICIFNHPLYDTLKKGLDYGKYFRLLVRICVNQVEIAYEDVIGNLEEENYYTALQIARDISFNSMKALIYYCNESMDRDKWIPLKVYNLKRKYPEVASMVDSFFQLNYHEMLNDNASIKSNVNKLIKLSNHVIEYVSQNGGL